MFKNIQTFRINPSWTRDLSSAETALGAARFMECGPSQEQSIGWTEPRGESNGLLIEPIGGHWIAKIKFQSKILPGSVVKAAVEKKSEEIEMATGRKPGKKEKKEIGDEVRHSLLASAFTKETAAFVWFDIENMLLVIEAGSAKKADSIVTELVKLIEGLALSPIKTKSSSTACMSMWLDSQELPAGFTADRDCVLKAGDESKATVRYTKHALDIDEIRGHIKNGKIPTQLALTWESRVSFVLTDSGAIKKIEMLEASTKDKSETDFDANVAITTGELTKMIPAVIAALGGEVI